jgi:tetratricopeptide (TPR) repeat protein
MDQLERGNLQRGKNNDEKFAKFSKKIEDLQEAVDAAAEERAKAVESEESGKIKAGPLGELTISETIGILGLMNVIVLSVVFLGVLWGFIRNRSFRGSIDQISARVTDSEKRMRELDKRIKDASISFQKVSKRMQRVETGAAAGKGSGRRFALSSETMQKILGDSSKRVQHIFSIGESFLEMEDCETAIEWFDTCIELDQKFASAWIEKGIALAKLSEYQEAMRCLYQAAKLDGQGARAWYNLACVANFMGNQNAMYKAMREAVSRDATIMERLKHDKNFAQYAQTPEFVEIVGG